MNGPQLEPGRFCYIVTEDERTEDGGYVPSVVVEGDPHRYPLRGNGPYASPWVWGKTMAEATEVCRHANTEKLGLTADRVAEIVASSLRASFGTPEGVEVIVEGEDGFPRLIHVKPNDDDATAITRAEKFYGVGIRRVLRREVPLPKGGAS